MAEKYENNLWFILTLVHHFYLKVKMENILFLVNTATEKYKVN